MPEWWAEPDLHHTGMIVLVVRLDWGGVRYQYSYGVTTIEWRYVRFPVGYFAEIIGRMRQEMLTEIPPDAALVIIANEQRGEA